MPGRDGRFGDKLSRKPCLRNRPMGGIDKTDALYGYVVCGTLCFVLKEVERF